MPAGNGWLFPDPPRDFPLRRALRALLRALHILAGGVLLGGYVFTAPADALELWWIATVVSGGLLLATDLHASCALLLEVRGVIVAGKLLLLLLVPLAGAYATVVLSAVLMIGAIGSHMPGRYRHRLLFLRDRLTADRRRG